MSLTLNQFKIILTDYFNNHQLIENVYYMDNFDFQAITASDYPICNIEYLNSSISRNVMFHNYKFVIGDITSPDNIDMEDNIHSDSLGVAEDFYTFLQNTYTGIIFDKTSTIQKFTDDAGDRISGIVFTCKLGTIRKQNICDTPVRN
jgi:hypothetical protein